MNNKQRLRIKADTFWKQAVIKDKPVCEVCGQEPTETGHHFFPKNLFGHLRYNLKNGIAIGRKCHFNHHHRGDPTIHQRIIFKRGIAWYTSLLDISRENPASYQTTSYYEETIKNLQEM